MVYVFLADGFEEIEALTPVDIMRRAGIDTVTVGVTGKTVTGAHGIKVESDILIDEAVSDGLEMVVLPGGLPGADNLRANGRVRELTVTVAERGGFVSAICAAPRVLGELGLLKGKMAICYPGFEEYLEGAEIADSYVCRDGNIITAIGMGASADFALELVKVLKGSAVSDKIAEGIFA